MKPIRIEYAKDEWFSAMTRGVNYFPQNNHVGPLFTFRCLLDSDYNDWLVFERSVLTQNQERKWSIQATHQHLHNRSARITPSGYETYKNSPIYGELIESGGFKDSRLIPESRFSQLWIGLRDDTVLTANRLGAWIKKGKIGEITGFSTSKKLKLTMGIAVDRFVGQGNDKRVAITKEAASLSLQVFSTPEGLKLSDDYKLSRSKDPGIDDEAFEKLKERNFVNELHTLVESRLFEEFPKLSKIDILSLSQALF